MVLNEIRRKYQCWPGNNMSEKHTGTFCITGLCTLYGKKSKSLAEIILIPISNFSYKTKDGQNEHCILQSTSFCLILVSVYNGRNS